MHFLAGTSSWHHSRLQAIRLPLAAWTTWRQLPSSWTGMRPELSAGPCRWGSGAHKTRLSECCCRGRQCQLQIGEAVPVFSRLRRRRELSLSKARSNSGSSPARHVRPLGRRPDVLPETRRMTPETTNTACDGGHVLVSVEWAIRRTCKSALTSNGREEHQGIGLATCLWGSQTICPTRDHLTHTLHCRSESLLISLGNVEYCGLTLILPDHVLWMDGDDIVLRSPYVTHRTKYRQGGGATPSPPAISLPILPRGLPNTRAIVPTFFFSFTLLQLHSAH